MKLLLDVSYWIYFAFMTSTYDYDDYDDGDYYYYYPSCKNCKQNK